MRACVLRSGWTTFAGQPFAPKILVTKYAFGILLWHRCSIFRSASPATLNGCIVRLYAETIHSFFLSFFTNTLSARIFTRYDITFSFLITVGQLFGKNTHTHMLRADLTQLFTLMMNGKEGTQTVLTYMNPDENLMTSAN